MIREFVHGTPVYLTEEVRAIETAAAHLPERPQLMARAGLAAAEIARDIAGESGKPVLIFAGPGNNGGDALVIARHLKQWFFNVNVVFSGDENKLPPDSKAAYKAWRVAGGSITTDVPIARDWGLVVDGLFGIGLQREISGRYAELVAAMNEIPAPKLAVDIPSGIESDTGRVLGCALRAHHTVTFIALKPGLLTLDGPDHCGELHLCPLGLDAEALAPAHGSVLGDAIVDGVLAPRQLNTHKGDFGSVAIIGGAHGMVGAALLAGRAALKLGSGRVYLGLLAANALAVDPLQPELMVRTVDEVLRLGHLDCLAVGPGLGQSADALAWVTAAVAARSPLVIDADGLNLIAGAPQLQDSLKHREAPTLLTPHPAEAARLLGCTTSEVQGDRIAAARHLASGLGCGVVLKGAGSVCAAPDGRWAINRSGNPGMAAAGQGDVLTGIIAALLAQGAPPQLALHAGVYLHGAAADHLVKNGVGPRGLTAGETIEAARLLLNRSQGIPGRAAHRTRRSDVS